MNKKLKRPLETEHRAVKINQILKLDYIVEMTCWCGNVVVIDSSKDISENVCSKCSSPIKLLNSEWTEEEKNKILKAKGLL